ncbi:MAG: pilus assembly protein TadG-related protein [Chloroflexota bacterium]
MMLAPGRQRSDGQILVLFVLSAVAAIAMVGLVIDGGATFAQRRGQQNSADLAALAGANALIFGQNASVAALRVTAANGYENGVDGTTVTVTFPATNQVQVDITAPHQNYFAGVVGLGTWPVGVTATAEEGVPAGDVIGAAPIIFSEQAFDPVTGLPHLPYGCEGTNCTPFGFGDGNGDVPNNPGDVAWTVYGPNVDTGNCNGGSSTRVKCYLAGISLLNVSFSVGDYIGQSNGGFHNALFGSGTGFADPTQCTGSSSSTNVDTCLSGKDIIVPIVSPPGTTCNDGHDGGCFEGWALFHVVSAEGQSTKEIQGYFVSGFSRGVGDLCADGPSCAGFHGLYGLRLIN